MRLVIYFLIACVISGCTSYLYSGKSTYQDVGGDQGARAREVLVFWGATKPFYKAVAKTDPVTLVSECNRYRIQFDERANNIYSFVEAPDKFTLLPNSGGRQLPDGMLLCGLVNNKAQVEEDQKKSLEVFVYCNKTPDQASPATSIPASSSPYLFHIDVKKEFKWWGGKIPPPTVAACR